MIAGFFLGVVLTLGVEAVVAVVFFSILGSGR